VSEPESREEISDKIRGRKQKAEKGITPQKYRQNTYIVPKSSILGGQQRGKYIVFVSKRAGKDSVLRI
jgi:hypothetical protein